MAGIIANKFVKKNDRLDFSRSIFNYEKRHSTNLLAGAIVPVHTQFLYPGTSPDWNFGCVIESAPLISTNFDNIYVDIVSIFTPLRLVMTDWNEFLGESHSVAFTINRDIVIPKVDGIKLTTAVNYITSEDTPISRAYLADNFLAPHLGLRLHQDFNKADVPTGSAFKNGISVLPSRIYELNWNTFFRNENVQAPILISKTSTYGDRDVTYKKGLGSIQFANKLKTWYTIATPNPSLLDVSLGLGDLLPVTTSTTEVALKGTGLIWRNSGGSTPGGARNLYVSTDGNTHITSDFTGTTSTGAFHPTNLVADTAALTVNKMYYALMEQRFANKLMKGRRAVEFYQNFFGVTDSDAGHDLPQLLCHKRFPLNITQVIATGNGSNGSETSELGQRGAYSVTGFGDSLVKNFTATEHGYIQTYMIIRGQPSIASGIDHFLGIHSLLDTYIPEFDHIGPVGIETLEITDSMASLYFGYTNAWYAERNQVSDVVGIMEPDQPLGYKTLANNYGADLSTGGQYVISDSFIRFDPRIIDKIFAYPVCYGDVLSGDVCDEKGQIYLSNRYQFLTQFVVKGKFAAVMSPDSEPLKLRL